MPHPYRTVPRRLLNLLPAFQVKGLFQEVDLDPDDLAGAQLDDDVLARGIENRFTGEPGSEGKPETVAASLFALASPEIDRRILVLLILERVEILGKYSTPVLENVQIPMPQVRARIIAGHVRGGKDKPARYEGSTDKALTGISDQPVVRWDNRSFNQGRELRIVHTRPTGIRAIRIAGFATIPECARCTRIEPRAAIVELG